MNYQQEMKNGCSRLYVVSPELLCQDRRFDGLWKDQKWTSRLARIIFDEGHCVSQWGGTFRPEYASLDRLRYFLPHWVQYYVASATLPPAILDDVRAKLHMKPDTHVIHRSNDRWNCALVVRCIKHSMRSFRDLDFLVASNWRPGSRLPQKCLIFFNSRKEAEAAAEHLRRSLGHEHKDHVLWFHSIMSDQFREETVRKFQLDDTPIWGLFCTDAAGMVSPT
jgi:superfamily II DNA helicase RecQ